MKSLTAVYGHGSRQVVAVDDVSFDVGRGETLALVGESGSGKSTIALALMRLLPPGGRTASGEILLEGMDLGTLDEAAMDRVRGAKMALIFQEPMSALNPVRTIGSQLVEALEVHGRTDGGDGRRLALDVLTRVRMDDPARRFDQYPHELSGGLRQRAMIAIALSCRPAIVIADEPTTALDVTLQAEILNLLRELKRDFGLSLLLVTHDLGVVAHTADRVAVMYAGRIVEEGPVRAVFKAPAHPYTQALLRAMPGATPGTPGGAPGSPVVPRQPSAPVDAGNACAFAPRCEWRHAACDEAVPDLYPVTPAHRSRCFLVKAARDMVRS